MKVEPPINCESCSYTCSLANDTDPPTIFDKIVSKVCLRDVDVGIFSFATVVIERTVRRTTTSYDTALADKRSIPRCLIRSDTEQPGLSQVGFFHSGPSKAFGLSVSLSVLPLELSHYYCSSWLSMSLGRYRWGANPHYDTECQTSTLFLVS
jgi:hypothetical protein